MWEGPAICGQYMHGLVVLEYSHVHNKYNPIQEAINLGVDGFGRVWRHGYWEGPDEGKGVGKRYNFISVKTI